MAKIAFVGAGSTVFAKNLLGDILLKPELAESTIAFASGRSAPVAKKGPTRCFFPFSHTTPQFSD